MRGRKRQFSIGLVGFQSRSRCRENPLIATRGKMEREYYGQTTLSPLGAAALLPLCAVVLFAPRRGAIAAFLTSVCFISDAQRINVGGADLTPIRALIFFGVIRLLVRTEFRSVRWQTIDVLFILYVLCGFFAYASLYEFEAAAVIRRCGELYTYGGLYFLFRCWLRDREDVTSFAKCLAAIAIPCGVFFAAEWLTAWNVFSVFGGVRAITWVREGRLRCQGAFPHPILAGCFWAGAFPIVLSLVWQGRVSRLLAVLGLAGSLLVIAACNSSTPLLGMVAVAVAALLFPVRSHVRYVQAASIISLVIIHFIREKPVWHLLARVNVMGGSTGWHRYFLIDNAIKNFGEWWLLGTKSTAHWGHMMYDMTNQYLLEGVRGGVLSMVLFIAVLVCAFRQIGALIHDPRADRPALIQGWLVGASLFCHAWIFFSVSYFGQVPAIYWSTIAAAVACGVARRPCQKSAVRVIDWRCGAKNGPSAGPRRSSTSKT